MGLDICIHLWTCCHNQGNRHLSPLKVLCASLLFLFACLACFKNTYHEIYSLNKFGSTSTVWLTLGVYGRSLELTHLSYLKLYTHGTATLHFSSLRLLAPPILLSASGSLPILDVSYKRDHAVHLPCNCLFHLAQYPLGPSVFSQVTGFTAF